MKHRATKIVLFLLLGAIFNVAVAWGCATWHGEWVSSFRPVTAAETHWLLQNGERPSTILTNQTTEAHAFGSTYWWAMLYDSEEQEAWRKWQQSLSQPMLAGTSRFNRTGVVVQSSGLPVRSLQYEYSVHTRDWAAAHHRPPAQVEKVGTWESPWVTGDLPTQPIWPGFAINTLFYAVVLWLLFAAPFTLRRRRRIKRGLCPACAYPVGDSAVCTECGQHVHGVLRIAS